MGKMATFRQVIELHRHELARKEEYWNETLQVGRIGLVIFTHSRLMVSVMVVVICVCMCVCTHMCVCVCVLCQYSAVVLH